MGQQVGGVERGRDGKTMVSTPVSSLGVVKDGGTAELLQEPPLPCIHGRLIEDVFVRGRRTENVRCLECGAMFHDPYRPVN